MEFASVPYTNPQLRFFMEERAKEEHINRVRAAEALRVQERSLKSFYHQTLSAIFSTRAGKPLPEVCINDFLKAAAVVHKNALPCADTGLNFVLKHKEFPDCALIVSYDRADNDTLKHICSELNPQRALQHALAPRVDNCSALFAQCSDAGKKPSGQMLVVRGFARLDLNQIQALNKFPDVRMRGVYEIIMQQLKPRRS
jgi:hypothetical protein